MTKWIIYFNFVAFLPPIFGVFFIVSLILTGEVLRFPKSSVNFFPTVDKNSIKLWDTAYVLVFCCENLAELRQFRKMFTFLAIKRLSLKAGNLRKRKFFGHHNCHWNVNLRPNLWLKCLKKLFCSGSPWIY